MIHARSDYALIGSVCGSSGVHSSGSPSWCTLVSTHPLRGRLSASIGGPSQSPWSPGCTNQYTRSRDINYELNSARNEIL